MSGSVLIKCLGHPHGLSEKARVIKDYASFKAQSEDKNNGGRTSLVSTRGNRGKFGLGYKPMQVDIRKNISERTTKGQGLRLGQQAKEALPCHISKSFISAGLRCEGQVTAICEDDSPR